MRRKLEDRSTRKLAKRGNSYMVTLPIDLVRELNWKDKQKLTIKRTRGGLVIRDWKE